MLLVIVVPAFVMQHLAGTDLALHATVGEQPGGPLAGRLVERGEWDDARRAEGLGGHVVELWTVDVTGERAKVAETASDADGAFAFEAPPVHGRYELATGGGLWQRTLREASFLDRSGGLAPTRELELPLRPGCELVVTFTGRPGSAPLAGSYDLTGEMREGAVLGLLHQSLHAAGDFEEGVLELDGLPPMSATLRVFFGMGDELTLELELEPGRTEESVDEL
ncbi:MAG: hypothetical protein H6828_02690 [Planctomycetes bacterium]|nr:hypothetical protein [Planctomycetota bacterium]